MRHILTLLAALLLASPASLHAADAPRKPNFLFIYTDDQRWDAMSVVQKEQGEKARFPWLKTPNMDRLAGEGMRFRNAFVVNSLCAPSRASFLTGCYGHVNGVRNNQTPFPVDNVTHASLLRQAGYVTGYVGKWHMDRQSGQRPGFDYSASFIGQGQYFDCPFEIDGQATPTRAGWTMSRRSTPSSSSANKGTSPSRSCSATRPATAPSRHRRDTRTPTATPSPAPCRTSRPRPSIVRTAAKERRKASAPRLPATLPARAGGGVPTNLGMFRGITAVDDNIGKLLRLLDELRLADDTLVVFCSDNGYYLGEHGLGDKRSAYEESLRIPLLVRYPRLQAKGKLVDQMVLNIDLAPTLLDFAGVAVPRQMHGRSCRPLLEGRAADDWRRSFFYCYFREAQYDIPPVTAVRTDAAKLIKYPGHDEWTELFDLKNDPYETRNLAHDPASAALRRNWKPSTRSKPPRSPSPFPRPPMIRDHPDKQRNPGERRKRNHENSAHDHGFGKIDADALPLAAACAGSGAACSRRAAEHRAADGRRSRLGGNRLPRPPACQDARAG